LFELKWWTIDVILVASAQGRIKAKVTVKTRGQTMSPVASKLHWIPAKQDLFLSFRFLRW